MADHRCNPAEPFEEGEAFQKKCINRFEQMERRFIKDWNTEALLPKQRAHRGEMKLTMLQLLKGSTDGLNIAD